MRVFSRLLLLPVLFIACGPAPEGEPPTDLLASGDDFIEVPKPQARDVAQGKASAPSQLGSVSSKNDFYLAIRKDLLGQRWFLSAYMKQYFPGDAAVVADASLGTRVVSFRVQNDKLFVFDASDQFKASELQDPEILVEAYPIVRYLPFDLLLGSSQYVLIDPAAGLNRFGVTGELFQDPTLVAYSTFPFRVGLSYLQNFRSLSDGAAFEQVFTGEVTLDDTAPAQTAWGTLGISLRRYAVGDGYVPTPDPGVPHYFRSDFRLIPDSGYQVESNPVKWNIKPGMKPVKFVISAGAQRAQADFPDVDILGALKRGIESWNAVFGFPVFEAVFVNDDRVRDDDQSFLLVDYPGAGNPFAFADFRSNPNNGEIRGGSVYFGGDFFGAIDLFDEDASSGPVDRLAGRPRVHSFLWGGMPGTRPACVYAAPHDRKVFAQLRADGSRTAAEKGALFIQHVLLHEMGHVLGLRHNFQGSLVPPSTSAMDYLDNFTDAIELATPGPYDTDALRYLYRLSPNLPHQPFCTDEDTEVDPTCALFDSGANPLWDYWAPLYAFASALVIDLGFPTDFLDLGGLNEILAFARDTGFASPADRSDAVDIALGRTRVPIDPADAVDPFIVSQINAVNQVVLRRTTLDPAALRGAIVQNVRDPGALSRLSAQAGAVVRNEDGVRVLALRRTAVDVLKRLQSTSALLELRLSRDAIQAEIAGGTLPPSELPLLEDLLARIQVALNPYFD